MVSPAAAIDLRAVAAGGLVALVIAVPAATTAQAVIDDGSPSTGATLLFGAVALVGLLAGGWVAGWRGPKAPLAHGTLAALAAFVVAQAVALATSSGDAPAAGVLVNAVLAASVGLTGGWLADRVTGASDG